MRDLPIGNQIDDADDKSGDDDYYKYGGDYLDVDGGDNCDESADQARWWRESLHLLLHQ